MTPIKSWSHLNNVRFIINYFYLKICDKAVIKACVKQDLRLLDVGKLDTLAEAERFYNSSDLNKF